MGTRNGYLLLSLLLIFSTLALSNTVIILEQDTRLKRFGEKDLKLNIDTLRRGIDLFRYKYTVTEPTPAMMTALQNALAADPLALIDLLAAESFIRGRLGSGSMDWRVIQNHVRNPSFEKDTGEDYGAVGAWKGNFTAGDGVPDGWELTTQGAQQVFPLAPATVPATYVVSFWFRAETSTGAGKVRVWPESGGVPFLELNGSGTTWKRFHGHFQLPTVQNVRLEITENSGASGDEIFLDGIMLEPWTEPGGANVPVPSAWTADYSVSSAVASDVVQQNIFQDLVPADATPASLSWWLW